MPRGGARPNSGPAKGTKYGPHAETISKAESRELVRQAILKHLDAMLDAQVSNAKGLKYLVTRDKKSGKFIRVTEAMAKARQGDDEEIIEVWEKDPSVQAFTDLMNRALDKPKEQEQEVKHEGTLTIKVERPW